MLVGGVVQHQIHDDTDVALLRLRNQTIEILHRAILRVDGLIIRDVVAEVDLRRRVDGRQPDGVDAKRLYIIKLRGDAVEVADTVAVRILKTSRIDFVDDGASPPGSAGRGIGMRAR